MLELIGTFDEALRGHGAARQRLRRFDASQLGEFMKEAYRIVHPLAPVRTQQRDARWLPFSNGRRSNRASH